MVPDQTQLRSPLIAQDPEKVIKPLSPAKWRSNHRVVLRRKAVKAKLQEHPWEPKGTNQTEAIGIVVMMQHKKGEGRQRTRHQWLTPVILSSQEAEIRTIVIQSQPWQTVHETYLENIQHTKKQGWCHGSSGRVPT
jgi:hypothetical protein